MDMSQHHQFCLKWNNHSSNLLKVFGRLFSNVKKKLSKRTNPWRNVNLFFSFLSQNFQESFTDVTLAAEGRSFRAHKVKLYADFFRTLVYLFINLITNKQVCLITRIVGR